MAKHQANRRQREAKTRRYKRRRKQITRIGIAALTVVAVAATVWLTTRSAKEDLAASLEAVRSVEVGSTPRHVTGEVTYQGHPPAGGDHAPRWQTCGVYSGEIPDERGVHSLEHGAVWITYSPGLSSAEIDTLEELGREREYVLVSPMQDLPSPVVVSAWGKQLELPAVDDPRLEHFVKEYVNGPQTLEPGAPCSGGESTLA